MLRRLATLACVLALLATLVVAFGHHHALASAADFEQASCALCAGSLAPAPPPELAPLTHLVLAELRPSMPAAPTLKVVLPLSHSGNAPPARG